MDATRVAQQKAPHKAGLMSAYQAAISLGELSLIQARLDRIGNAFKTRIDLLWLRTRPSSYRAKSIVGS